MDAGAETQATAAQRYLPVAVFAGGAAALSLELTAARLLQPFFGSSNLIWANVIGLTLIYLALGAYLGGRVADRRPERCLPARLLLWAGLTLMPVPLVARPLLRWSVAAFDTYALGVFVGSLFGVLALFSAPLILLGMVTPVALRLCLRDVRAAGSTAGTLSALATLGSIMGTFLPVLVLIPLLGTRLTLALVAVALVVLGAVGVRQRRAWLAVALALALMAIIRLGLAIRPPYCQGCEALYETESRYNYIQVARANTGPQRSPQLRLILNEGQAIHSVYNTRYGATRDPVDLITGGPWDFFHVAPYLYRDRQPAEVDSLLLIGAAAGTIPKQFLAWYGWDARIDAVEIDPVIVEVGRRFFAMDDPPAPNYRIIVADGRVFVRQARGAYDLIGVDAYQQPYIPFHLTTREFFSEARARLTARGVVVVNAGREGTDERLARALASTMRSVFPQVFVLDVPAGGNVLLIGVNQPVGDGVAHFRAHARLGGHPILAFLMHQVLAARPGGAGVREWTAQDAAAYRPFTDDWAPVEAVIDRMIVQAVQTAMDQRP